MNNTSELLAKQYTMLRTERDILSKELLSLPFGSIQQKKIKNGVYFYRQYRKGSTVKAEFVPEDQIEEVRKSNS